MPRPVPLIARAPLLGATVVVTRPSASAATLKRRIVALGGKALGLPALRVCASADADAARAALREAATADSAIFSSPAAVRYAFALLPRLRFARRTLVAAVGAATARALTHRGVHEVLYPDTRQDSEGLLALPELQRLRRRRVVLIGAPGGRELLAPTLRKRGARVLSAFVYERASPRLTQRHLRALEAAPRPLVTLLSSVEALAQLGGVLPLRLFARLAEGELVASSARVAAAARASLFAHVHVAASAENAAMLAAAAAALARHRL